MQKTIFTVIISFLLIVPSIAIAAQAGPDGSFNHSVEIKLPPGTNGLAPHLSLDYNSNAGNGIAGLGWQLGGLPVITRDSSPGIYYGGLDTYCGRQGKLARQLTTLTLYSPWSTTARTA